MTARRQASTTSLAKYARQQTEEELTQRQLDFCNAFWGPTDNGVGVMLSRLRGTARTMDDLRGYWKERSAIEEDYSKRMHALGNRVLGKDELGELRNSVETLRSETLNQAATHRELMSTIRRILEAGATDICTKQANFKRNDIAAIEKAFKNKQAQEAYVEKAREKYEADCLRINSYTAQSTLVQGRDFDKLQLKLDRARQTVQGNERDYVNFSRALADTYVKWERDWKAFCDKAQDLEDERIEFMKNNMWEYANSVSTTCVQDDESCEKLRIALEAVDTTVEQESFVREYASGPLIPNPPLFIDYVNMDPNNVPQAGYHTANYARSSLRPVMPVRNDEDEGEPINQAGIGAGGGQGQPAQPPVQDVPPPQARSRASSRARSNPPEDYGTPSIHASSIAHSTYAASSVAPSTYGGQPTSPQSTYGGASSIAPSTYGGAPSTFNGSQFVGPSIASPKSTTGSPTTAPQLPPIMPSGPLTSSDAPTMLKIGQNAFPVDLNAGAGGGGGAGSSKVGGAGVGGASDPLERQMQNLQSAVSAGRRTSVHMGGAPGAGGQPTPPPGQQQQQANGRPSSRQSQVPPAASPRSQHQVPPAASPRSQNQVPPAASPRSHGLAIDYGAAAEAVVGAHPASRPSSPAPTAKFMQAPNARSPSPVPVEEIVGGYAQSFPGENRRASVSRQNSINGGASVGGGEGERGRPVSRQGHAGVGAHGRGGSVSPAPPAIRQGSSTVSVQRSPSPMHVPLQQQQHQQRAASPGNRVGIQMDAHGRVTEDSMASRYGGGGGGNGAAQGYHAQAGSYPNMPGAAPGYGVSRPSTGFASPAPAQGYGGAGSPVPGYGGASTSPAPGYGGAPNAAGYAQQQQQQQQQQQIVAQHSGQTAAAQYAAQYRGPPTTAPPIGFPPPTPQQGWPQQQLPPQQQQPPPPQQQQQQFVQQQQQQQQQQPQHSSGGYGAPPPAANGWSNVPPHDPQQQQQQNPMYGGTSPIPNPQPQLQQQAPPPTSSYAVPPPDPAAPPTGQYTEDGRGVLFYVKALYDYRATVDEEFDFQKDDIIAVTSTPEDGWWTGWLLDDTRRQMGRNTFPSNFVCLF